MPDTMETILFLGATGGVTNAILVNALNHAPPTTHCVALVRTPSKLRDLLEAQKISPERLSPSRLTILIGNAIDQKAVREALLFRPPGSNDTERPHLPTAIVTGIGGTPGLTFNFCTPLQIVKLDNPNLCTDAAKTLVAALKEIYECVPSEQRSSIKRPRLVFISTTGVTRGPEDVPLLMRFFYHQTLAVPHKDKKEMENVYRSEYITTGNQDAAFQSVTGIRPTLLTGGTGAQALGTGKGWQAVKAGTESRPALGMSIARVDVGQWVWVQVLSRWLGGGDVDSITLEKEWGKWEGEMCSLTT